MVSSFRAVTLSANKRSVTASEEEYLSYSRKRKHQDGLQGRDQNTLVGKRTKSENTRSLFDIELKLQTPSPSETQLSVKSKRTSEDQHPSPESRHKMRLDLEMNLLPADSVRENSTKDHILFCPWNKNSEKTTGLNKCPSWLAFADDDDDEGDDQKKKKKKQEMVASVCMRCHMLVMLCKSAPVCPNCKFMHPYDHSSLNLFKSSRVLSLLC